MATGTKPQTGARGFQQIAAHLVRIPLLPLRDEPGATTSLIEASNRGSGPASNHMETKKMKRTTILIAALLGLGVTAAMAEVEDANGDGVFSMDEVKVTYPDLTEEVFTTLDTNADGALDAEELAAGVSAGLLVAG